MNEMNLKSVHCLETKSIVWNAGVEMKISKDWIISIENHVNKSLCENKQLK